MTSRPARRDWNSVKPEWGTAVNFYRWFQDLLFCCEDPARLRNYNVLTIDIYFRAMENFANAYPRGHPAFVYYTYPIKRSDYADTPRGRTLH